MLNCVSGEPTTRMARLLGQDAHLVSYGAMSKQPLSLPTSIFIFNNLTSHGFWQSRWYQHRSQQEREKLYQTLAELKLEEPEHQILDLSKAETDDQATQQLREVLAKAAEGRSGKKILLKM